MTRTEMITRLCEMVADFEEMGGQSFVSSEERISIYEIETKIHVFLKQIQNNCDE